MKKFVDCSKMDEASYAAEVAKYSILEPKEVRGLKVSNDKLKDLNQKFGYVDTGAIVAGSVITLVSLWAISKYRNVKAKVKDSKKEGEA